MITAFLGDPPAQQWPRIEAAAVSGDGQTLGVMVREYDGTISAISIGIEQLAD